MRVASLFSGVGGFELGLVGKFSFTLVNDIDLAAQVVLRERFSTTSLKSDVRTIDASDLGNADMIVAGFPCQDVSIVGGQRGLNGVKTALVKHVFRLVESARPDWIFLENVQSIRFVHGGRVLEYLTNESERFGYSWAYRTLDSRGFGLPQRRRRFYFLASRVEDPGKVLLVDRGSSLPDRKISLRRPIGFYWTEGRAGHGLTEDAIPPLKSGSAIGIPSPPAVLLPNGSVCLPTIETAEQLQGFPAGWTAAAPIRDRWRLIGNAVSPPVVRWIGAGFSSLRPWSAPKTELSAAAPWPLAAWGDGRGRRYAVDVREAPEGAKIGKLSELNLEWHLISRRALLGFTNRARSSNLRYPEGFLDTLERAIAEHE